VLNYKTLQGALDTASGSLYKTVTMSMQYTWDRRLDAPKLSTTANIISQNYFTLTKNMFAVLSFSTFNSPYLLLSPSLFYLRVHSGCRGILVISFDHTQTHATGGRTPLDEGSACHRDPYLTK
jgi:hypothetical protein